MAHCGVWRDASKHTDIRNAGTLAETGAPYLQTEEPVFIKLRNVVSDWFFTLWESWLNPVCFPDTGPLASSLAFCASVSPCVDESFKSRVAVQIEYNICIGCACSSGPGPGGERGTLSCALRGDGVYVLSISRAPAPYPPPQWHAWPEHASWMLPPTKRYIVHHYA